MIVISKYHLKIVVLLPLLLQLLYISDSYTKTIESLENLIKDTISLPP